MPKTGWSVTQKTVTDNYTPNRSDYAIWVDASAKSITITFPAAASSPDARWEVKKEDATTNPVTLLVAGGGLIDGAATYVLSSPKAAVTVTSDGVGYQIS